jgi:anti-sigma regulatory factor (Ser/Thr protein kinase)
MLALSIPSDSEGLDAAQGRIEAWLRAAGGDRTLCYRVRLVVEELAANLAMHGRFEGPAPPARIELRMAGQGAVLAFEDAAAPFDPRSGAEPPRPSLDGDAVGGLGLALVRKMAEITDYRRLPDGWNRTELLIRAG